MTTPLPFPDARLVDLLQPSKLVTAAEVLTKPSPVPRLPGVYVWYFDSIPAGLPTEGCHNLGSDLLLYAGISPKAPPSNGAKPSRQTIRSRIRYHFKGNAKGSTLRLTLGCLLSKELGIQLRRVGGGDSLTFTNPGEQKLDLWMAEHARVVWVATPQPWLLEDELITHLSLPLNVMGNERHPFCKTLRAIRSAAAKEAHALPIVTDRGGPRRHKGNQVP